MPESQITSPARAHQGAFSVLKQACSSTSSEKGGLNWACFDATATHCFLLALWFLCMVGGLPSVASAQSKAPSPAPKAKIPPPEALSESAARLGSSGESCTKAQDCAFNLKCLDRVCVDPTLGREGDTCTKTADCNGHLRCVEQICHASSMPQSDAGNVAPSPAQATSGFAPTTPMQPAPLAAPQSSATPTLAAPYATTPLPAPSATSVTEEKRVAGSTVSVGLGYGNGGDQDGGTGYGVLGFIQLSRASGFSYGVPVVIAHFSSTPVGSTLAMSGFQIGRWAYVQALGGLGSSGKSEDQFTSYGTLTRGYKSNTDAAIGLGVGLTIEFSKRFGLTTEAVVTKVSGIDSYAGGFLVGPTFFPWGTRR